MTDEPDLEGAYALGSGSDAKQLYANWAESYDAGFAQDMSYALPQAVAHALHDLMPQVSGRGAVLDLGAGTGLVGEALAALGFDPVDGTDLSPEMLEQARAKAVYRHLFEGDLTKRLDVATGAYGAAVSAGTFTNGHVGPEALEEVLRVLRPDGWAVLSVNARHWDAMDFAGTLDRLAPLVRTTHKLDIPIYGDTASGDHAKDRAWLLQVQRA